MREVRLIVIAAVEGDVDEARFAPFRQTLDDSCEPEDARERLGRHAQMTIELPRKMPLAPAISYTREEIFI